jgi:hypothetical protein
VVSAAEVVAEWLLPATVAPHRPSTRVALDTAELRNKLVVVSLTGGH